MPIPGTTSLARLQQNVEAAQVSLDSAELAAIDAIMPKDVAAGARYASAALRQLGR